MSDPEMDAPFPEFEARKPLKSQTAPLEISLAHPFPDDLKLVVAGEPPQAPKQERAWLEVVRGGTPGRVYPIDKEVVELGRWDPDCDAYPEVDLSDDDTEAKVSRRHARIIKQNGAYFLIDWGSRNGTYVNGGSRLRTGQPYELNEGEELAVGNIVFTFHRET